MMRCASWYRFAPVVVSALTTPRSIRGIKQLWCSPAGVMAPLRVRKMLQSSCMERRISS